MSTASLLPQARFVAYDPNGAPLAGGFVYAYVPGGTVPKTTWQDAAETIANSNPIVLDANGSCLLYGSGTYQLTVTDSLGNQVPAYSGMTSDTTSPVTALSTTVAEIKATIFPPVATIAALQTATTATLTQSQCYVMGYASSGDGGEGIFYVGANATANGGTIVNDGSGRSWYRETVNSEWSASWFGALVSLADNTAAVNAAIVALGATGGGILRFGAGVFTFVGTVQITPAGITLQGAGTGATTLLFNNGTLDCIAVGATVSATAVTFSTRIFDLTISGTAKTGGFGINVKSSGNGIFQRLTLSDMPGGVFAQFINNVLFEDIVILIQNASNYTYAIGWVTDASLGTSNVLGLTNVTINCNATGAHGVVVDGATQTLRMQSVGIIHAGVGLLIKNSAGSNTIFPQFIFADDLEIDGVLQNCVLIEGGRHIRFVNSDFFNNFSGPGGGADTDCIFIAADGAASVTTAIWLTACRIAGAQGRGIYCEAKNVDIADCYVGDNSLTGSGDHPGVQLGNAGGPNGAATSVTITGGQIGAIFGDIGNQSIGTLVDAGVSRVTINGVDYSNCVTGAITDNTGGLGNVMWHGCIDINGAQFPDRLPALPADTSLAYNGLIYYDAATSVFRVYQGGALKTITAT